MSITDSRVHVAHVPQMFDPQRVHRLREYLACVYAERQALARNEREAAMVRQGAGTDALRMDPRWFDLWRSPSPTLHEAVGPFTWIIFPPVVRLITSAEQLVPWHQDLAYQRVLGARGHSRIVTCFVPLDDNPAERPTVEFCPSEERELEHHSETLFAAGIRGELGPAHHFSLRQGDALVFGDMAIHRTYCPPGCRPERASLEFRLVCPADALADKEYFEIPSGQIVRTDGRRQAWVDAG
jgi:hypothetical protein